MFDVREFKFISTMHINMLVRFRADKHWFNAPSNEGSDQMNEEVFLRLVLPVRHLSLRVILPFYCEVIPCPNCAANETCFFL